MSDNPNRIFLTYKQLANVHAAARLLAKRILPDRAAVKQFNRVIRATQPYVDEYSAQVDAIRTRFVEIKDDRAQLKLDLEISALNREPVDESDEKKGIPGLPLITEAMLPKKLETSGNEKNDEGLGELCADLGVAFSDE